MRRCPGCGHHHGTHHGEWPRCGGIVYTDDGAAQRCACTNPEQPPNP
ncbi:hypothetical protein HOU49_gp53 [Arthrobacter phage Eileen]|uniref:Uncharacterized protein n=1 Tax=Arthrobacter phage Eileen TaxID=2419956 RepID=A0A3G2KFX4_9CAUD|nr:hypothetical protein HOU49_gp53 [Arthrobacter phage Eileen]AYN57841.1 hypothetical protein PBI_EILEEN_53 [Arthrobacter phage Eileen]